MISIQLHIHSTESKGLLHAGGHSFLARRIRLDAIYSVHDAPSTLQILMYTFIRRPFLPPSLGRTGLEQMHSNSVYSRPPCCGPNTAIYESLSKGIFPVSEASLKTTPERLTITFAYSHGFLQRSAQGGAGGSEGYTSESRI